METSNVLWAKNSLRQELLECGFSDSVKKETLKKVIAKIKSDKLNVRWFSCYGEIKLVVALASFGDINDFDRQLKTFEYEDGVHDLGMHSIKDIIEMIKQDYM